MTNQWQPIETAPKNPAGEICGPTILVYNKHDGLTWPAFWGPHPNSPTEGVWLCGSYEEFFADDAITHWMPLPPDPDAS